MNQEMISLFLQFIPESLALAFSAAVFLKVKIDRRIAYIGLIEGVMTYFLRRLSITFGYHTIISIILYTTLLTYFYDRKVLYSFLSILRSFILLALLEIITIKILVYIVDKPIEEIIKNPLWKTIAVMPQVILLFLIGWIILQVRKKKE